MKNIKLVISTIVIFFMIFSMVGTVFGTGDATISVAFDKENVEIGENITLTVTIRNTGDEDLNSISVLVPLPTGLKFIMSATGTSKNNYDPATGVWQVDNLRLTSKGGGVKTLTITSEVTSELSGKTASTYAKFTSIAYGEPPISILDQMNQANTNILSIKSNEIIKNNTKNETTTPTNKSDTVNTDKKTIVNETIKNATKSKGGLEAIQSLDQPSPQTAYEISNTNNPGTSDTTDTIYTLIGGLIIAVLIVVGYFKGLRG